VFDPSYKLRSLYELNGFIKQNKHLPEIAPANDMEKDGVDLSKLNMKFLQKIEELTLYTIQQKKEIDELAKQNRELLEKNEILDEQNSRIKQLEEILERNGLK